VDRGLRGRSSARSAAAAYDTYGLSEIVGPGVAGECEARRGLHVWDDHFLPESRSTPPPARRARRARKASSC
jgi:phenylacetate-CoA ligase